MGNISGYFVPKPSSQLINENAETTTPPANSTSPVSFNAISTTSTSTTTTTTESTAVKRRGRKRLELPVNSIVSAKWGGDITNGHSEDDFYPARIKRSKRVDHELVYDVVFYDGAEQSVSAKNIKKLSEAKAGAAEKLFANEQPQTSGNRKRKNVATPTAKSVKKRKNEAAAKQIPKKITKKAVGQKNQPAKAQKAK